MLRLSNRKTRYGAIAFMVVVAGLCGMTIGFRLADQDYFFKLSKSIDIFGKVYKEVAGNYVDEVDPEKFM